MALQGSVNVSSASTLTLTAAFSIYVYNGSTTATWTLPPISGNTGEILLLFNRGTGLVTTGAAGTNQISNLGTLGPTIPLVPGGSLELINDGTYWISKVGTAAIPSYDNSAHKNVAELSSGATTTFLQTVGVGSPYGVVVVNGYSGSTAGVTYMDENCTGVVSMGGVAMPQVGKFQYSWATGSWTWFKVFAAPNIPPGSQTVSVKLTQAGAKWDADIVSATYLGITGAGDLEGNGYFQSVYPTGGYFELPVTVNRANANPGRMLVVTSWDPTFLNRDYNPGTTRNSQSGLILGDFGTCGSEAQSLDWLFDNNGLAAVCALDLYSGVV